MQFDLPGNDIFEITVIARGTGESIVAHRPGGRWLVVDSFHDPHAKKAAPLAYLEKIGVKDLTAIEAVVLTHLHSDHYRSIDKLYHHCGTKTWLTLPGGPIKFDKRFESALTAISTSKQYSSDENRNGLKAVATAYSEAADFNRNSVAHGPSAGIGVHRDVWAIAPRSQCVISTNDYPMDGVLAMSGRDANLSSIVLMIQANGATALLGGDMECDTKCGWQAVINDQASNKDFNTINFLKMPHHCGSNQPFVSLLADRGIGSNLTTVVTPRNVRADAENPHPRTIDALAALGGDIYSTSPLNINSRPRTTRSRNPRSTTGLVRSRWDGSAWDVATCYRPFPGDDLLFAKDRHSYQSTAHDAASDQS